VLRRISVDELAERGLLEAHGAEVTGEVVRELLERTERQAEELGRLRFELAIAHSQLDRERRRRSRRPI
jgi:hypothetical protein